MRAIVPVQMGCCPGPERCRLCVPRQSASPELVEALVETVREEKPGSEVQVSFFGGPPPTDAHLDAAGDHRIEVRVRPDLLDREGARRLRGRGVARIELDALSFNSASLRASRRSYAGPRLDTMLVDLKGMGFEVGVVLAIGLPGQSHATSLADAEHAASLVSTARLHPVLVVHGSSLWNAHLEGLYEPITLGQAVTTAREMLDVLEGAGVSVIRIGQQPGPDGLGRVVAGPRHSSLRELVEARRTLDLLRDRLRARPHTGILTIRCSSVDETRTRGPFNDNIRTLRAEFALVEVVIIADPTLQRGTFVLEAS